MKIQPVNFNQHKNKYTFKARNVFESTKGNTQGTPVGSNTKTDPEGHQIQADGENIEIMYKQAMKIREDWGKERVAKKEYFTHAGTLEQYVETRLDGSQLIIGYFSKGPYHITQKDKTGNEINTYIL